jgi:hypothetical protein
MIVSAIVSSKVRIAAALSVIALRRGSFFNSRTSGLFARIGAVHARRRRTFLQQARQRAEFDIGRRADISFENARDGDGERFLSAGERLDRDLIPTPHVQHLGEHRGNHQPFAGQTYGMAARIVDSIQLLLGGQPLQRFALFARAKP